MVEALGDELEFRVITRDREQPGKPYPYVEADRWVRVGRASVFYLSPSNLRFRTLFQLLSEQRADFLYLNSFFSNTFSIMPVVARELGARSQGRVILAPRGEFSPGALLQSRKKKRAFLSVATRLPAYRRLIWHASTHHEENDIRNLFGSGAQVRTALPLSNPDQGSDPEEIPFKRPGSLKVVFLGRIVPKKNLLYAIRALSGLEGEVDFSIVGPVEDQTYWRECAAEIQKLPARIRVQVTPAVEHDLVAGILSRHHVFVFPTHGENYGHVIYEALNAGRPVIISDQTPWRELAGANAGFDIPLERPEQFGAALEHYLQADDAEFRASVRDARAFVRKFSSEADPIGATRRLFTESGGSNG
jgi:glycosyltransferase involved in cell wall biosynthesis